MSKKRNVRQATKVACLFCYKNEKNKSKVLQKNYNDIDKHIKKC